MSKVKKELKEFLEYKKKETTFTRYEFEFELNCLKDFIQHKDEGGIYEKNS